MVEQDIIDLLYIFFGLDEVFKLVLNLVLLLIQTIQMPFLASDPNM